MANMMFREWKPSLPIDISLSEKCLSDLEEWAEKIIPSTSGRKLLDLDGLKHYNSRLNERFESIEDRIDRLESALSTNEKRELFQEQLNEANKQQANYTNELLMAQLNASNQQQIYNICESLNASNQQQMYNIRESLNAANQQQISDLRPQVEMMVMIMTMAMLGMDKEYGRW